MKYGRTAIVVLLFAGCASAWDATEPATPSKAGESTGGADTAQAYYAANGFLNRGLYDLAVAEYGKFLSAQPNHDKADVARYGLAVSLFRLNRFDEAVVELKPLFGKADFAFAPEVAVMLGQCYSAKEQFKPAAEAFLRVVTNHKDHALAEEAAAGAAEALYRCGKTSESLDLCRRFIGRSPNHALAERVRFFWALAALASNDYAVAAERFAEVAGNSASPLAAQASLLLGQCRFQLGDWDLALKALGRVGAGDEALQDDVAYWTAKCQLRQGRYKEAAEVLRPALTRFETSEFRPAFVFDLAFALLHAGDVDGAVSQFEKFLKDFPAEALAADALHLLALAEHQRRHYDVSAAHCRKFLAEFSSHEYLTATLFLAAENEYLSERWEPAVEGYQGFLSKAQDPEQILRAKLRLGTALARLARWDEALPPLRAAAEASERDSMLRSAWLTLGDLHFQRGEWKLSAECLARYTALGANKPGLPGDLPSVDDALLKLGLSMQRENRWDEAIAVFDRLLKDFGSSPHRGQAQFEKAQALSAAGRSSEAEKAFSTLLADPTTARFAPYAENHRGGLAMQRAAYGDAIVHFESALRSAAGTPIEAEARLNLGKALVAERRYPAAEKAFAELLDRFPADPRAAEARANYGISLSRQDQCERALEAISILERDSAAQPSRQAEDRGLYDSLRYEKAVCLRKLKRAEADAAFRTLLTEGVNPVLQAHALLELADSAGSTKRFDDAAGDLKRLRELIASAGKDLPLELKEQALYRSAVCEFERGKMRESAELFEEFLAAFSESSLAAAASLMCGEAQLKLERFDRAAEHLQRLVDRFPSDPGRPAALLRLGEALASLHRWAQSETVFAEYLQKSGDSELAYQARFGVGWARENLKQHDEAISAYREVVARHLGPTAARAQFQIGECLFAKQQYQEAVAELLKVDILYAYPEWSAAALYEAGRCFEKLAKPAEAQVQFRAVVEKFGQTQWAALAKKQLADAGGTARQGTQ